MATDQDLRPRYYEDQFLGAADLEQAVQYGRVHQARHALGAHTWGISVGLDLIEKPRPGGGSRVDVFVTPGYGWDGFGRAILVLAPASVPEALFADIKFDPQNADDRDGIGRLIPVWLRYDQQGLRPPPRGFETCDQGDHDSRIQETFRIVAGEFARSEQHGSVVIDATEIDPREALNRLDAFALPPGSASGPARTLWDESIPHQEFPADDPPLRWLVPIGAVRWLPTPNGPGHFVKRDESMATAQNPAKRPDSDVIRAQRRYAGIVAESIEGAGGVIRLRDRFKDPDSVSFRPPRIATDPNHPPENEVVWVEGDLRVVGDARLAGGKLTFRTPDDNHEGTPLEIRRSVGQPGGQGNRSLQVIIGPDTQETNRFAVGPLRADQSVDHKLVVTSAGDTGIRTESPRAALDVLATTLNNHYRQNNQRQAVLGVFRGGTQEPADNLERARLIIEGANNSTSPSLDFRINDPSGNSRGTHLYYAPSAFWPGAPEHFGIWTHGMGTALAIHSPTNNVGIGTIGPQGKLTVADNAHINVILDRTDTSDHMTLTVGSAGSGIHFGNSNRFFISADPYADRNTLGFGREVFTILPNGNTGIGTPVPTEKLEVNGNLRVNGLINGHDLDAELQALLPGGASNVEVIQGDVRDGQLISPAFATLRRFEKWFISLKTITLPAPAPFARYHIECSFAPPSGPLPPGFAKHGEVRVKCTRERSGTTNPETTSGIASYIVIGYD